MKLKVFFKTSQHGNKILITADSVTVIFEQDGDVREKRFKGAFQTLLADQTFVDFLSSNLTGLCAIHLSHEMIFERPVELPYVVRNDYKNVLQYELPSLLPLHESKIYCDSFLIGEADHKEYVMVSLAMIKKHIADELINHLEKIGLHVKNICAPSSSVSSHIYQFVNLEAQYKAKNRTLIGGLCATTMVLGLLCFNVWLGIMDERIAFLNSHITELSVKSQSVLALEREIENFEKLEHFYRAKASRMRFEYLLEQLTGAIPEDSWLSNYRQAGRKITMSGTSPNTGIIIEQLSQTQYLTDISNNGTRIRSDSERTVEQFTLSMRIVGGDDDE